MSEAILKCSHSSEYPLSVLGRIVERKFRDLPRFFAVGIAAGRAAELTPVNNKTAAAFFHLLRLRMAEIVREGCPFRGEVEVDESYFGPARTKCQPRRGAVKKNSVFGILNRNGRVHGPIAANCSEATLKATIAGDVHLSAALTSSGFRSYDGLVEAGFPGHHRNNKHVDPARPKFDEKVSIPTASGPSGDAPPKVQPPACSLMRPNRYGLACKQRLYDQPLFSWSEL